MTLLSMAFLPNLATQVHHQRSICQGLEILLDMFDKIGKTDKQRIKVEKETGLALNNVGFKKQECRTENNLFETIATSSKYSLNALHSKIQPKWYNNEKTRPIKATIKNDTMDTES
ncbi:hypothetical protein VNO77_17238 [Canavalia gladiata]|uniref:Uncharacterized protein n=1 Tax=Canavalia gladiata TaxID=3824 RepID=A0AAN9QIK6_CANGL